MELNMNRSKINNMKQELQLGRIERPDEPTVIVTRPILNELWQIFYRKVPQNERTTYKQFINELQGLTDDIASDPASVELDAFAKEHRGIAATDRETINLIISNHVDMAKDAYIVEMEEEDFQDSITKPTNKPTATSIKQMLNRRQSRLPGKRTAVGGATAFKRESKKSIKNLTVRPEKSQVSDRSRKMSNHVDSQRTVASSMKHKNGPRSSISGGGFKFNQEHPYNQSQLNLDLKLSENPDELMLQRKHRFESLKKIQSLMEKTELEKPVGFDFL